MLALNETIAGDYVIDALIGKGGMGCVYRAHAHTTPHVSVAIKEMPPTVRLSSGQLVAQGISNQLKLAQRVNHPNIAQLLDAFYWNESFYLVFEYVAGRSLQSIVAETGPVTEQQALQWARELCDILGYLHALEPAVVYRDMKPSNVLVGVGGKLTLIDLGIAREFKTHTSQTKDTVAFGTQGYAPPEQYGSAQTDARSDIYALGCTLWHVLAGTPPPVEFPLPSIRLKNPRISEACEKLIQTCTQLEREKRFQSCAELAVRIDTLLENNEGAKAHGPAEKLARAFKSVFVAWPPVRANKHTTLSEPSVQGAQPEPGVQGARGAQDAQDARGAQDARPERGIRPVPGARGTRSEQSLCVQETGVNTHTLQAHESRVADFCFTHACDVLFNHTPTTLLNTYTSAQNRATGELCSAHVSSCEFFFTIVQNELCVNDNVNETSKKLG